MNQLSFNWNVEQPDPRAFLGSACDHRIKLLSDSRFEQKRRRGFCDLPFDFIGSIFGLSAMRAACFIRLMRLCIATTQRTVARLSKDARSITEHSGGRCPTRHFFWSHGVDCSTLQVGLNSRQVQQVLVAGLYWIM
jgi:hypothetical protein